MTTHPIYDDFGATDDRGSWKGHLRSHEVTISRQDGDRDAQMVPKDFARQAVSESMHIGPVQK